MLRTPKKRRTPEQRHNAWLAWRVRGASIFNDVCTKHIGLVPPPSKRKCCRECPGCGSQIKTDFYQTHLEKCVAYLELEALMESASPEDVIVTSTDSETVQQRAGNCYYCGKLVRSNTEEWHWRNGCEASPFNSATRSR